MYDDEFIDLVLSMLRYKASRRPTSATLDYYCQLQLSKAKLERTKLVKAKQRAKLVSLEKEKGFLEKKHADTVQILEETTRAWRNDSAHTEKIEREYNEFRSKFAASHQKNIEIVKLISLLEEEKSLNVEELLQPPSDIEKNLARRLRLDDEKNQIGDSVALSHLQSSTENNKWESDIFTESPITDNSSDDQADMMTFATTINQQFVASMSDFVRSIDTMKLTAITNEEVSCHYLLLQALDNGTLKTF
jgi:hypothetical protein